VASPLTEVPVALGDRAYRVVVADGFDGLGDAVRADLGARRFVVVTDGTVEPLWGEVARAALGAGVVGTIVLPAGEPHKHLGTWRTCVEALLALGLDRRVAVIALGGGVVGDVAGFAAATVLRGLNVVQVPTTVLAMVDSSVGGKTAVNTEHGKNLVGVFHQPSLVWAPLDALETLDARERVAGLAEVVKTGLVVDADLFDDVRVSAAHLAAGDRDATRRIVARSVAAKAEVVAADERESGPRICLNAGHTVGHAIENVAGYGALRHGEAVGVGLVAETTYATRVGLCADPDLAPRVAEVLRALGLPTTASEAAPGLDRTALAAAAALDKKADGDRVIVPLVVRPGHWRASSLDRPEINALFEELA
jgi:3-dehydroquinate synthase